MKYIALIRTFKGCEGCNAISLDKSDFYDEKNEAEKWLAERVSEFEANVDDLSDKGIFSGITAKSILAFDENESSEYERFFETTIE